MLPVPGTEPWLRTPIPGRVGWFAYAVALCAGLAALVAFPRHGGIPWLRVELAGWVIGASVLLRLVTRSRARRPVWGRVGPLSVLTLLAVMGLAGVGFAQNGTVEQSLAGGTVDPPMVWTVQMDPMATAISTLAEPRDFADAGSFAVQECPVAAPEQPNRVACWSTPLTLSRATAAIVTMFDHGGFTSVDTTCAAGSRSCAASGTMYGLQAVDASIAVKDGGGCAVTFTLRPWPTVAPSPTASR